MRDPLTLAAFEPEIGRRFRVQRLPGPAIEIELVGAADLSRGATASGRAPFSLLFRGPFEPVLSQRIWALEPTGSSALSRMEIFLVPVGPDASGMQYEAIFN